MPPAPWLLGPLVLTFEFRVWKLIGEAIRRSKLKTSQVPEK